MDTEIGMGKNIEKKAPSRLESLALQDEEERRGDTQSKPQDERENKLSKSKTQP
jgi:hypothetical protein